tara:strand:- start:3972 stop:4235 length:264 start_codon:yes stop_codon:yes gene_type:complete
MFDERELLETKVEKTTPLKEYLVEYTGEKLNPDDANITVEMIIRVLADDFPEVVLALAEENFIRGYKQGLEDISPTPTQEQNNDIQE